MQVPRFLKYSLQGCRLICADGGVLTAFDLSVPIDEVWNTA